MGTFRSSAGDFVPRTLRDLRGLAKIADDNTGGFNRFQWGIR